MQFLRRGDARFQSVDFLLLVGNLLLQGIDLGFPGRIMLVIRIRQIAVLLQRKLAFPRSASFSASANCSLSMATSGSSVAVGAVAGSVVAAAGDVAAAATESGVGGCVSSLAGASTVNPCCPGFTPFLIQIVVGDYLGWFCGDFACSRERRAASAMFCECTSAED